MRRQLGVTLIELAIAIAIIGVLLAVGLPAFSGFLANTRIKNAAQTTLDGIALARTQAVQRNTTVRFQLVSNLSSNCTLSASSLNWVVSRADPTNDCDAAPSETASPFIVQKKSGAEGATNVAVTTVGSSTIIFNALGRVVGGGSSDFVFSNPGAGTCEHEDATNGTMRCLRIMVSPGGQTKLCDPKVDVTGTDPRRCS